MKNEFLLRFEESRRKWNIYVSSTITSWYCDRSRCNILTTSRDNETPGHRSLISLNHPGLIASISSLPQVLADEPVSCLAIRLKVDTVGQLIVDKENKSANFFMWPNMFPYDTDRHFHSRCSGAWKKKWRNSFVTCVFVLVIFGSWHSMPDLSVCIIC